MAQQEREKTVNRINQGLQVAKAKGENWENKSTSSRKIYEKYKKIEMVIMVK